MFTKLLPTFMFILSPFLQRSNAHCCSAGISHLYLLLQLVILCKYLSVKKDGITSKQCRVTMEILLQLSQLSKDGLNLVHILQSAIAYILQYIVVITRDI